MVLVEGPWSGEVDDHLRSLQDRMFGCLEAALEGQLAEQFPNSRGKTVVVRIDCYDVPQDEVDAFVKRFAEAVADLPDYSTDGSPYVGRFQFEVGFFTLPADEPTSAMRHTSP
jgi:hypothetical protein